MIISVAEYLVFREELWKQKLRALEKLHCWAAT